MKKYPDFVGIGSTRAGSSWLHYVLSSHPDIWMSPVKELHFYDCPMNGKITFTCDFPRCKERIKSYLSREWNVNNDGFYRNLIWDYRYFFKKRSEIWYGSLFAESGDKIAGEITPGYAILEKDTIVRMASNNTELRAIYLLRNPIERGWSSIVNGLAKKNRISIKSVPVKKIFAKIDQDGFLSRSNYAENIRKWSSVIGHDRLFIGFFEDIIGRPRALIDQICDFLGVRDSKMVNEDRLHNPRNVSKYFSSEMQPNVAFYLAQKLYPMIKDVHALLGGYTHKWLEDTEKILRK